jgi:hypothetical protein
MLHWPGHAVPGRSVARLGWLMWGSCASQAQARGVGAERAAPGHTASRPPLAVSRSRSTQAVSALGMAASRTTYISLNTRVIRVARVFSRQASGWR